MMGRLNHDQGQLFYSFHLDEVVPDDHLVREIAAILDLSWVHRELAAYYPKMGRPSIDPELMIRMLIVGYVFAIRSERMLCREVKVNLAYRWFCGLSIEDSIPDHSAFSRADCGPCPLKAKCCPKAPWRKIPCSIYEDARAAARALANTQAFEQSRRDRKRVEMLFAHLKRILKLGRLRLRGPCGAQDEFTLAAIAQNLRRLAKLLGRPPPAPAVCAA